MGLMEHVVNVGGFGGKLTEKEVITRLKPGLPITRICWEGCMATIRVVDCTGHIVRHETRENKYPGVIVKYNDGRWAGKEIWEPLQHIAFVGAEQVIEVWR